MSEEESKHLTNEDDDERHRREEAERRAKRKVWFHVKQSIRYRCFLNHTNLTAKCLFVSSVLFRYLVRYNTGTKGE